MGLPINQGGLPVVTAKEMYRAEDLGTKSGTTKLELMENACRSVVSEISARWTPRKVLILCGPGQNGGDGLGVACLLRQRRWTVEVALDNPDKAFLGNAKIMAERWGGTYVDLASVQVEDYVLIIDALYGIGLNRALEGYLLKFFQKLNRHKIDVVAIDIPSGISADTGEVLGGCATAVLTITFGRPKCGHFLVPGKIFCGELIVADIGLKSSIFETTGQTTKLNGPDLWLDRMPFPESKMHKYDRGHAVVVGGGSENSTGAGLLAAESALRAGAGLVTIAAPADGLQHYRSGSPSIMVESAEDGDRLDSILTDERKNVVLIGPGTGVTNKTLSWALRILSFPKKVVLDADALTCFSSDLEQLFELTSSDTVLTPHDGEFNRLFPNFSGGDKITRTRMAAQLSGAVIVYKGSDTIIADPEGSVVINSNAPATLASAGTGDVLSGIIAGFLAQGCSAFDASCIGVWCHGLAATKLGAGLISSDLVRHISEVKNYIYTKNLNIKHNL